MAAQMGAKMTPQPHRAIAAGRAFLSQTRAELAAALEERTGKRWTAQMITNLEHGRTKLDVSTLALIAEIQGLPMQFYLEGPAATVRANPGSLKSAAASVSAAA